MNENKIDLKFVMILYEICNWNFKINDYFLQYFSITW